MSDRFMNMPIAAWESDWSGVVDLCRRRGVAGAEELIALSADSRQFRDAGAAVRLVAVNPAALELMGVDTREEFERWNDAYPAESARRFARAAAALLFGDQPVVMVEIEFLRADGQPVEVLLRLKRGEDWSVRPTVLTVAIERGFISAEEKYRRLFGSLPVAAWESECSELMKTLRAAGIDSPEAFAGIDLSVLARALDRTRTVSVNAAALELMGTDVEELWKSQAYPRQSLERLAARLGPFLFGSQRSITMEVQLRRAGGEPVDALVRFARAENWETDCTVFAIALEMTEAKRTERALLAAKTYVDNLIETGNVMIVELDLEGHATRMNRMGEEITGWTRDEMRTMNWFSVLAPPERQNAAPEYLQMMREGRMPLADEAPIITRDGRRRMIAWRNTDIRNEDGEIVGIISFGVDVTEQRHAEAEQRRLQSAMLQAAEEWRRTFDAVNTPILIVNGDGLVTRVNHAAADLAGRRFSELIGTPLESIRAEPWETAAELIRYVSAEKHGTTAEARDRSGRTWDIAATRFSAPDNDAAVRFIVVLWEITSMLDLQESLRRSETLSAMGNLVAGVAHEVRNPLFGISATLDAYHDEMNGPGYADFSAALRSEVSRLRRLMQELLDYGKPAAMQLGRVDLREVVESGIRRTALPRSDVKVDNAVPHDLPQLLGDSHRLQQVFENVIDNAMHHSPPAGTVRVTAIVIEHAGRTWIEARVEDSGPGFRDQELERVFEPFFTGREGGTGLGLSIVQRIVQEHSGRVWAGNRPEGGGVITILLPIANG